MGGEVACTRASGLYELGTDKYDQTRRRKVEFRWEAATPSAGETRRARAEAAEAAEATKAAEAEAAEAAEVVWAAKTVETA